MIIHIEFDLNVKKKTTRKKRIEVEMQKGSVLNDKTQTNKQTNSKRVLEQANSTKERESINREQFTGRKKNSRKTK